MTETKALKPVDRLKGVLSSQSVQEQFKNALKDGAPLFVASIIDLYSNEKLLQDVPPAQIIAEALKAATLKLPINKSLGFAYIVPFKENNKKTGEVKVNATFILGYKGYIQLAMRTGEYRVLNADMVYEGELKGANKLTGEIDLTGEKTSDTVIGYFGYFELLNGFKKTVYWKKEELLAHAKKYSKGFSNSSMPWQTEFDEMALKTVIRNLISKYGYMSIDMQRTIATDIEMDSKYTDEIEQNANSETIDIEMDPAPAEQISQPEQPALQPDW